MLYLRQPSAIVFVCVQTFETAVIIAAWFKIFRKFHPIG